MKSIRTLVRQDREKYVIPRRVQDVIPIQKIWEDGIFLTGGRYAKTFRFTDINYQVASEPDKEKMFRGYSALINSLDCGATTKITIFNHKMSQINFEKSILMPMQWDGLDDYREEYNQMLLDKATNGNGIVQEKFLTVSVRKKDVDAARSFFARVEADLSAHFAALGSACGPMNAMERLQILHRFYRRGEENEFRFSLRDSARKGHSFRDYIYPDSMERHSDYLQIGERYARVLYLKDYASYIQDDFVSELTNLNRDMMLSIDMVPIPTDEAVREVENRLLGVETNITNWQRRQNSNNNFSAVVPYDMELQRKESKEFLDDLTTRDQRMIFGILTMVITADTPECRYSTPNAKSSPAGSAAMEYSGNPAVRRQIAEASNRHGQVRQTATEPPEPQSRVVQAPRPIRTRAQQKAVSSAVKSPLSPTQQQAARKAAAENIVKRKQEQKNALRSELAQKTGILESIPQETTPASSSDIKVVKSPSAQSLRNGGSAPEVPTSSVEVPIKKKASVPIRTRQGAVPIKTPEGAATKATDPTTAQTFREAKKATVAAAQKNAHAAATAGRKAMIAPKKAAETAAKLAKSAAEVAKALYAAIIAGGAASILVIVIVVLIGCGAAIFGSQDESTETLPLSAEVEAYELIIRKYAKQYDIPDYVLLIQAVMMQESGGRGSDPMQASECGYNTQYPRTPGGITDPEYSIAVGIQNLADCLQTAGAESPIGLDHIQLALQGYNFGSGYITWALQKYGEYSRANAIEFSLKMAEQMGWNSYGDKQYVPHVLRYYPIGKVFYTPEDGDAIVDVALSQVGNVGGEPYWSWYGFSNHVEWCACFVSWCADQCGYLDSGAYPKFSGCVFGMQWFQQRGLWLDGSEEPTPRMLIFFDWATHDGVPDHVGIVEKVENGGVYTVEGNSRDMCRQKQYALGSGVILGYGMPAS